MSAEIISRIRTRHIQVQQANLQPVAIPGEFPLHPKFRKIGNHNAPIVLIADAPKYETFANGLVLRKEALDVLRTHIEASGLPTSDFFVLTCCPPIPREAEGSDSRTKKFMFEHSEAFWAMLNTLNPKLIVPMGSLATCQIYKKTVKITELQGNLQDLEHLNCPVLPILSPENVVNRPEVTPKFDADFRSIGTLSRGEWERTVLTKAISESVYEWCLDLQFLLDMKPKGICFDTETSKKIGHVGKALEWYDRPAEITFDEEGNLTEIPRDAAVPLICQISYKAKHALIVPLDVDYFPGLTIEMRDKLMLQVKMLLEDETIAKTGHNLGYDYRIMQNQGIIIKGWTADTLQLAFCADENMQKKSLDECVARWLSHYAGYSKEFERQVDYDKMREVPHSLMLPYAGGDTDTGLQLARVMMMDLKKDKRMWNLFNKVQMPALRAFTEISVDGMPIDTVQLGKIWTMCVEQEEKLWQKLLEMIPIAVRQAVLNTRKKNETDRDLFNFKSPELIRAILFTQEGYGLVPVIFTEATMNLEEDEQLASTSSKKHLPYFDTCPFVEVLEEYVKLRHLMSSFVGQPQRIVRRQLRRGARVGKGKRIIYVGEDRFVEHVEKATGLYQHISKYGRVHPGFHLHKVITGRTSCSEPNIQQVPKRDLKRSEIKWAKLYRKIYVADTPEGYIVAADLSQIELRLVAWMAQEPTMLQIYNSGGDIHAATGAQVKGMSMADFYALEDSSPDDFEFGRYLAKAVNFGFIYGAWWTTFKSYAKTQYGIDVSDNEAKSFRERFFEKFSALPVWHETMKGFAHENGYVRSLHGALRRLPSIHSSDKIIRQMAERQAVNSPIQRMGSDFGVMGLTRFHRDCPKDKMRVKGFVHDQVIVAVDHLDYVPEAASALKFYMETLPLQAWFGLTAPLPIVADVEIGKNMGELKKAKEILPIAPPWYREELDR